jgi:hypothetical protein
MPLPYDAGPQTKATGILPPLTAYAPIQRLQLLGMLFEHHIFITSSVGIACKEGAIKIKGYPAPPA